MKEWKIKGRFPTADEMSRMVAAEVRTRVEAALERETLEESVRIKNSWGQARRKLHFRWINW